MEGRIDLVLFDLDDVLYHYSRRRRAERLSEITGIAPEVIRAAIWDSGLEAAGDRGALGREAYLQAFGERIGRPVSLAEWVDARRAAVAPNGPMLALAARLRAATGIAVLTNNPELLTDHVDVICPELRPLFGERIFASASFGAAKPDAVCFERCLAGLAVAPSAALFVDDLAENVAGARAAGLHAHHFTSVEAFRRDLVARGLET
ncbi:MULTISPECIES: HAD family phosphatase [Methylobacterium]|jgi:HAD superfamily hydrolase (TIGR01509 family)|uniref:HAD family hydrolase n=1 Tax=Methylobacterium TaxID=407 RepID=UPI0008EC7842|nr:MULTISPECIES: HAD family phosphatase [Methylobacterium]MBZ6412518.1 HAD family phosphatase [Methylobacterium sp.]MBK3395422.1 HAD family phosphatase [Methylobacterium ajmalii]MBK3408133.1 HAD family phosphatase [Methylobacterium ajmalii]MBK3423575.1 HAD family phosphatase [Methylobacterium ajmalii]SFF05996.1 putative hydrolase of the HAD superfamily [Methylobacterium sp. yr596]